MWLTPRAAIVPNQTKVIGPKNRRRCHGAGLLHDEQADQDAIVIGTMKASSRGGGNLEASTADSTEMAGVNHTVASRAARTEHVPRRFSGK